MTDTPAAGVSWMFDSPRNYDDQISAYFSRKLDDLTPTTADLTLIYFTCVDDAGGVPLGGAMWSREFTKTSHGSYKEHPAKFIDWMFGAGEADNYEMAHDAFYDH